MCRFKWIFPVFSLLVCLVGTAFAGENKSVSNSAPPSENNSGWFTPFDGTDWGLLAGVALADLGDFASSNYNSYAGRQKYNACASTWLCTPSSRSGEGNSLITGLYGTKYPNTWQYASWFAGEFLAQALVGWVLPRRWRDISFGIFIGVGAADTVVNGYHAGIGFRF